MNAPVPLFFCDYFLSVVEQKALAQKPSLCILCYFKTSNFGLFFAYKFNFPY